MGDRGTQRKTIALALLTTARADYPVRTLTFFFCSHTYVWWCKEIVCLALTSMFTTNECSASSTHVKFSSKLDHKSQHVKVQTDFTYILITLTDKY